MISKVFIRLFFNINFIYFHSITDFFFIFPIQSHNYLAFHFWRFIYHIQLLTINSHLMFFTLSSPTSSQDVSINCNSTSFYLHLHLIFCCKSIDSTYGDSLSVIGMGLQATTTVNPLRLPRSVPAYVGALGGCPHLPYSGPSLLWFI